MMLEIIIGILGIVITMIAYVFDITCLLLLTEVVITWLVVTLIKNKLSAQDKQVNQHSEGNVER